MCSGSISPLQRGCFQPLMLWLLGALVTLASTASAQQSAASAQQASSSKFVAPLGMQCSDARGGVIVEEVEPRGPAAELGLKKGDLLVSVNDKEVTSGESLTASLKQILPGETLRVQFVRDRETLAKSIAMPQPRVNMFGAFLQSGADDRVQVGDVSPNTPAEKAGLKRGDMIVSMAGQKPASLADLSAVIAKVVANESSLEPIELVVQRPREPELLTLVIERVPTPKPLPTATPAPVPAPVVRGVVSEPGTIVLGIAIAEQPNRVVVAEVLNRGPAAVAGILPGDTILSVAKKPTPSFAALTTAISPFQPGDEVAVDVQRSGKPKTLRVMAVKAVAGITDVTLQNTAANPAVPATLQPGVQVNVPVGVAGAGPVEAPAPDLVALTNEVRLLKARIEALENLVKQMSPASPASPAEAQRPQRPLP